MSRQILQFISWLSLAGTILPSVLFLAGRIGLEDSKWWLMAATIVWFVATPLWMGQESTEPPVEI